MEVAGSTVIIDKIEDTNTLRVKTDLLEQEKRQELEDKLVSEYGVDAANDIKMESISATVSSEMKEDAIVSVIIAGICMLIYIWIRFKTISFGIGAVLALLHDVLIVLMVYAVSRISVGNTFIACMLTIVGYSINATIVIYDRIRENKGAMRNKDRLADVVNLSITQTFSRSINTSLTTLIMVLMLAILGVESVREFAIPLIAGIIAGGYSSICIAGTLWYFLNKGRRQAV
jgi:SecD/SecF fusion protein